MDRYLMMLYVTLDQETALKHFFIEHGWAFSKPDLSITTDNVGPSIVPASNVEDTTERMAEFMSPAESLVALNQSVCSNLGRKRKKLTVARNSLLAKHPKSDLSELQSEETQCIDSSHSDVLTQSRSVNLTFPVTVRCENEQQVVIKLERADDELELTHQTHQNSGIDVTNNILDEIEGNSDNDNSENTSHDFYSNVDQPSADSGVETVIDTKEDILEPDMKRRKLRSLSNAERQRKFRQSRNADPVRRQQYLQWCKEKYLLNKQLGKIKSVKEMSHEENQHARSVWRLRKANYRHKKEKS